MARYTFPRPCVRSVVQPVASPITGRTGLQLGYVFQNATAETRVAELETAGATLTDDQKAAIDDFHVAKAAASGTWGGALLRLWLPVWGVEAANAIDIIGGNAGTFIGTVTHAAGYVQGDGTTGYFDTVELPSTLGITQNGATFGVLSHIPPSKNSRWGSAQTGSDIAADIYTPSPTDLVANSCGVHIFDTRANYAAMRGLLSVNRSAVDSMDLSQLTSSGEVITTSATAATSVTVTDSLVFMARNATGSFSDHSDAGFGAFFAGSGTTRSEHTHFLTALKNLWETCTGLTLP